MVTIGIVTRNSYQIVVHNASLSKRNHGRPAGLSFSPAAAPPIFRLCISFRWSIVAIKYRSASIAWSS
jgi:hypothetical protein